MCGNESGGLVRIPRKSLTRLLVDSRPDGGILEGDVHNCMEFAKGAACKAFLLPSATRGLIRQDEMHTNSIPAKILPWLEAKELFAERGFVMLFGDFGVLAEDFLVTACLFPGVDFSD